MSRVLKNTAAEFAPEIELKAAGAAAYLPAALAVVGSLALTLWRIEAGASGFISDGALMMLALAGYLFAAVFHLTNLYAPARFFERMGLLTTTAGVFFNLSSFGVRWIAAHDREFEIITRQGGEMPWFWRYVPFTNLYDLSLTVAAGAGLTTLLIARRENFRFLGALTLPLAAIILVMARFIGGEIANLPPVLDSYWRPIHVSTASLSYGVALVCFVVAIIYLLKDGVKAEAMAVWSSLFALSVFATISQFTVFAPETFGTYAASTFYLSESGRGGRSPLPLRVDLPYVGRVIVLSGGLLAAVVLAFWVYLAKGSERARAWGHRLLKLSLVAQAVAIATLVAQVRNLTDVASHVGRHQYARFGAWLAEQQGLTQQQIASIPPRQFEAATTEFIQDNGRQLYLSLGANPIELSALITAFAATFFVILFSFRTERLRAALPSLEKIDELMYKTAGITFAGLALLLITGAVWANESWGRYWGWDPKEVGALVAWLTYGGFLHVRISRGWTGRPAAYFAIVAFLFIMFTYLGVSYLLPGLHSYA
ncbi:MAG TPA: cytochrome c biogenesis protein CcsA [Pyrinomonadaceae bacterium]|nr:cytochrome c biogenesis protein CcsA [Pyrinomonadaceae bacterium]